MSASPKHSAIFDIKNKIIGDTFSAFKEFKVLIVEIRLIQMY